MKPTVILLLILVIIGLAGGLLLALTGEVPLAGVVWAVTAILCCIARRVVLHSGRKSAKRK